MSSVESFAFLANMLLVGGLGGYFVGWVLKRIFKILLIGLGILVFSLASLAFVGTINVNYDGMAIAIGNLFNPAQLSVILQAIANYVPLMASFAVGFLIGLGKQ